MDILNPISLESNSQIKINFDGGDLSSDAGLLLFKEFLFKVGAVKLVNRMFKTNDNACFRVHKDDSNLMQVIYQIISSYFEDDCADELTNEPVMTAILEKDALASQPTLSRFFNRMDGDTLSQLNQIIRELRKAIYSIKKPEFMLFDLDSTLLDTYGNQEGEGFNCHYQAHGYHPLLCCDGLTGDLLKAQLRDGTMYCGKEADIFMKSLLDEFLCDFPDMPLYFRGDSGFASPDLYEVLEDKNCKYAIRLKENTKLRELAEEENQALYRATKFNQVDYAVEYGEFLYQAGSWNHPRRVVFKIEQPYGQMVHLYTFIVTTMEMEPYQVIQFYCGRGRMENFIKEGKSGFDFACVSSPTKLVNANRLLVHALAYNLFNAYLQPELSEYDAWFNVKDDLLVLGVSVKDMDKIGHYYGRFIAYMEKKYHLRIGRQTKSEKWLMPHIRPGCRVDYGVGRVLFAGEVAGFLNPMGEGISAGIESGYCAACAIMGHFDNPQVACEVYRQSTENLKSYMQRQWSFVGGIADMFREME